MKMVVIAAFAAAQSVHPASWANYRSLRAARGPLLSVSYDCPMPRLHCDLPSDPGAMRALRFANTSYMVGMLTSVAGEVGGGQDTLSGWRLAYVRQQAALGSGGRSGRPYRDSAGQGRFADGASGRPLEDSHSYYQNIAFKEQFDNDLIEEEGVNSGQEKFPVCKGNLDLYYRIMVHWHWTRGCTGRVPKPARKN